MDPEVQIFSALVVSRPAAPRRHLPRLAVMILVGAGYLAVACSLSLLQVLVIETMPPPRAATGPLIIFRPPRTDGGGDRSGGSAGSMQTDPPPIHPPARLPVVVPLAPPAEERDEKTVSPAGIDSATAGQAGEGVRGDGTEESGIGPIGPGGGGDCPTCPPGPGRGGPLDGVYPDDAPGITPPVVITSTRALPKYPDLARRAAVQGSVVLLVVIDAEGRVGEIQVLKSPDPRYGFDFAAIEAVKQWRYQPARLAGRPVAVQASVLIEFTLSR